MKVLELFAGSRSFGKAAESLGFDVFSSDINNFPRIDYVVDILKFDINKLPYKIDIIWASPPCTYFSVASIGKHWNKDHTPKTNEAIFGVKVVKQTIKIIEKIKPKHWYIENPRGKLRKLDFMQTLPRTTVWYCTYGDKRAKPTDIWTNNLRSVFNPDGWQPRPECFNGNKNCHHEAAPRGSRTGTQGLKGNYERSKVPKELCLEILKTIK
jgi:site-specific DNA-cytosine methylase|tara:strand:- start:459 stop:1091 length:633 start_codon:yes stop_codon:yes gene_type:complete